jgi:hypothetical protein
MDFKVIGWVKDRRRANRSIVESLLIIDFSLASIKEFTLFKVP